MVKKVVNIGVEGNDASGDPIREAFNKVNENFNELYSAFGRGDGISITALEEGPDETVANSILIMNDSNTQYISKTLEGDGFEIINTDPSKIVFRATTSNLSADLNPQLSNHLDATSFNILRLGNPDQAVANSYNVSIDSFAINKGYADSRYVNVTGDTMTGFLRVPPGARGEQVARAGETVLKAGGISNQMTGPLILSRKIQEDDLPLTAATKEYVDVASYTSRVNLYVSTQGDDNQFNIENNLKGRSWAYAFKTISAACRFAKNLIDNSPITVGITVKDITYTNGQNVSQVFGIVDVGEFQTLSITNDGTQTDPRDESDIRPGQVIKGKVSGAIVKIEEILDQYSNYENYRVKYQTEEEFIIGEPLEYGNPTKDLNISIFVESGNYYEHYPIRVPNNVSLIGDELRRTIVRPRPGRSSSWAIDTHFRRDPIFDQDLIVASQLYGYHYLTNPNNKLYTGTVSNPGNFVNGSFILLQNRQFIIEEVVGYINTVQIDGKSGLLYDETKCRRDTGLIIDALVYDMVFGGNFASIAAARAYYRGTQAAAVLGADKIATLDALDQLKIILQGIALDITSLERISDNIDLMKFIIDFGYDETTQEISYPNPSNLDSGFINAKNLLLNNKLYIRQQIVAYIDAQISSNSANPSSIWYNLDISGEACSRDVGYIIEAVIYDLTYSGNWQSVDAGKAYFFGNQTILTSPELLPTLEAYEYLKTVVFGIITGGNFSSYPTEISRTGGSPGTTIAGNTAVNLVENIRIVLQNNGTPPATIYPSLTSVQTSLVDDFNAILAGKTTIQDDIITYLNTNYFIYNEDICRRDAGLIVDAIVYDLVYGDYYKSLEAANAYFENASGLIAITTQLNQSVAALERLKAVASRVVEKLPPINSYQQIYPESAKIVQYAPTDLSAEAGTKIAVEELVDFMINIITEDLSINPPKENNELDIFLLNEATIVRNMSCQEHGGFMCVLDPLGQILTKSPYVQTASSFSRSIDSRIFAGGMLVDAFAGNIQAEIDTRVSDTEILVRNMYIRLPNLPCAFYINGRRFEVDVITEWDQTAGTARVHINPNTPDDPLYTEIEDSTKLFLSSTNIEFLSAGNNSMLCNDYTQLNDLGYGLVAINGGLLEAVSVFTYYCYASYLADTGGQIRSVGGSSAHGIYGLVAAGSFPLEIPDDVYLLRDMVVGASIYSPFDFYSNISGTNLIGTGTGATFNVTVNTTSYIATINFSGNGYADNDQIIILGSEFGGIAGVNDLIITATSTSGGVITDISISGTIPPDAPINDYFNRKNSTTLYIDDLTTDFQMPNGCELEVVFGTAPNKRIIRYLVNNCQRVEDVGLPDPKVGNLYRLNLASGGLGVGTVGILDAIANNTRITLRMNTSLFLYDLNRETATRPATALIFDESVDNVNRVIAIGNVDAKVGLFDWEATTVTVNSDNHGLTPGTLIYLVFSGATNGTPSRGFYSVDIVLNANNFTIVYSNTAIPYSGSVSWGYATGEAEAQLKEPFRAVTMTVYYDSNSQPIQPFTYTINRSFSSTNEFNCLSTFGLTVGQEIRFTGTVGGVLSGSVYYINEVTTDTKFKISDTLGGPVRSLSDQTATMYGSTDSTDNFTLWGVTGSHKFAINELSSFDSARIFYGITSGFKVKVGWRGRVHEITNYITPEQNGTLYGVIELDDFVGPGLYEPVGLLEGGWDNNPNLKGVLPADSTGNVTVQISTVRSTGHDMLDIGTGSYAQTNFPNVIFGSPDKDPDQAAEVLEVGKGRCFFVTSDQDGNFRVGDYFQVDQGTGTVTFSSSIAISNLDGLGFKRGVAIAEFSVDSSMFDNATDTVPTEQAVRSYLDRRLGLTHNGSIISPASGTLIPNAIDSGFMALNGKLPMRANLNMGSFRINNLLDPTSGSDGATKAYADTKLSLAGGSMSGQIDMGNNKIVNLGTPTTDADAATKLYVDTVASSQNELRELGGVSLPNPVTGVTNNSLFVFNGTNFTWGAQEGDVVFTLSGNTLTSAIGAGVIVNNDISASAAIAQSKLNLANATANVEASAVKGIASFDFNNFETSNGWVTIKPNGIAREELAQLPTKTVLGNSSGVTADVDAITFSSVVQGGGALYTTQFGTTSRGVIEKNGDSSYTVINYGSADSTNNLVSRDSGGGFTASTINVTTQYNVGGNKYLGRSSDATPFHEIYTPQGGLAFATRTLTGNVTTTLYGNLTVGQAGTTNNINGSWTVNGVWTLASGATLEATYAADLAEYYEGDKTYEPGTVLMIGGDKEVTIAKGEGTTKVAGVVSNNAAYTMNGACPGEKNLIALQGRVPCKVIGRVFKGDLMVVSPVPGVAISSTDPKVGSIIGKALENYDSDHVGTIEVMVGKH